MRAEIADLHFRPQEEVVEGAQRSFPNIAFHHTVKNYGMTYGGLHETKAGAEASKAEIIKVKTKEIRWWNRVFSKKDKSTLRTWEEAEIIHLEIGETFRPWATGQDYIHGKTDGTHGSNGPAKSTPPFEGPARLLAPHKGF